MKYPDPEDYYQTVDFQGKTYKLIEDPYIKEIHGCAFSMKYYQACVEDDEGNAYNLIWDNVDWSAVDKSEACDWENPDDIEAF